MKPDRIRIVCLGLLVIFMLALPHLINPYWTRLVNDIGIYAILTLSLNIILGQTGMFNMGHAAFFAIGAYVTGILNTLYGVPVLWLLPVAGAAAALFGILVARPIIHLRGDYLLVVTIGIVEIVRITLVNNVFGLTGGSDGIRRIARPQIFGYTIIREDQFFYLIWGFAAVSILLFLLLERSRFGRALNYIKHDELAAEGSGVNTSRYKMLAFGLGAFWAGMAGTLFATRMKTIAPQSFSFAESVMLFAIVILGGAGNIVGVILGAVLLVGLQEVFRGFDSARMLVFGAAMVVMMIFRPQGILPPRQKTYDVNAFLGKFPRAVGRRGKAADDGAGAGGPQADNADPGGSNA